MSIETLAAVARDDKGYRVRRKGYIPAVIYGKKVESTPIQFVAADVSRYLRQAGRTGKVLLSFNGEEYTGILREVQTDPVTGSMLHLQIQVADSKDVISIEVPITFAGRSVLENEKLFLNVDMPMIKVKGPVDKIPESFHVDVSELKLGEVILVKDLKAVPGVEFEVPEDYVLASVQGLKVGQEEKDEQDASDAVETEATKE